MPELFIFDRDDNLLTILSNETEGACPFWGAPFREELNKGSTFSFSTVGDHEDSQHVIPGNQVAFFDKDGALRLFLINEPEDNLDDSGTTITAVCQPAINELNRKAVLDIRPYNTTLKVATERVLAGTRWEVGEIAELGINSINHYDTYALPAIQENINTWGGELRDRIEIDGNKITKRIIDIPARRGADTGKRWEDDKDIVSLTRTILFDPVTAIVGRGSSLEATDEEGEATGGYTRKISFKDVEWKVSKGDPVDKPKGQEWVGDPEALARYGLLSKDGRKHLEEIYENSEIEDPAELLRASYEYLQERNKVSANYTMGVFLLEEISGYEHEKARLGDTTFAITHAFAKPIEIEARIIVYEYDVADPENTGTVEMGSFIDLHPDLDRFDQIEADLGKTKDKVTIIDKRPVTDDKIENVTPTQPQNILATGSFKNVIVEWDFVGTIAIQHYEVYASQIEGFTPDISNLVYKGKTSIYTHKADSNQQWYFRVRAVNTHGVAGPFSNEASAETARIITDDILFGAINAQLLANLAVEAEKLAHQSVTPQAIAALAVGNAAIQNLAVTNSKIENLAVGEAQIENLAITNGKIANLAVDDAKIANLSVAKLKAGVIDSSKIKIKGGTDADYSLIDGSKIVARGTYQRNWQGKTTVRNITFTFENGIMAVANPTDFRQLNFSDYGISTYADGDGEGTASGTLSFFDTEYSSFRGVTLSSNMGVVALKTTGLGKDIILEASRDVHIYNPNGRLRVQGFIEGTLLMPRDQTNAYTGYEGEFRFTNREFYNDGNTTYNRIRASIAFLNGIETNTYNGGSFLYLAPADEVRITNSVSDPTYYKSLRGRTAYVNSVETNTLDGGTFLYLGTTDEVRVVRGWDNKADYMPIRARYFYTDTSLRKNKKNIEVYSETVTELLRNLEIYTYNRLNDDDDVIKQLGLMIDETPRILHGQAGDSFDLYALSAFGLKGLKEVLEEVDLLKKEIQRLNGIVVGSELS